MIVKPLFLSLFILAHSWYPSNCCNGSDCRPVPCKELIEQEDGSVKWKDMIFTKDMKKAAPDGMCHVCASEYPHCVFFPPGS